MWAREAARARLAREWRFSQADLEKQRYLIEYLDAIGEFLENSRGLRGDLHKSCSIVAQDRLFLIILPGIWATPSAGSMRQG